MFLTFLAVILFATACSSGASSPTPAPTSNLDGATLIQQRCSVCHPLSRVEKTKYPSAEWKTIVDLMISRGAQLTPEEEPVVVSYLAAHYGK
jgi:hypothetical protein